MLLVLNWNWAFDGWILAAAVLCALSCALLGNFMVLRRMSMMGDALSHAVLPGLVAAFMLSAWWTGSGSRGSTVMLLGAGVVGVLTALLTQLISQFGKVDESASMGVVFTSLFALGLILVRQAADHVDLDPGCVLYGLLESVPYDLAHFGPLAVPRVVLTLAVMFSINLAFVLVFYKELKISSFDPALATTLGINANIMHYLLMTMVAATTVASFEAVGSILVVAMLIVPAAAAHLLTDRLGPMIIVSLIIGAAAGVLGHLSAIIVPGWFDRGDGIGYPATRISGMMAASAGLIFLLVMLAAPRQGVISKLVHQALLSLRILREDVLAALYRAEELAGAEAPLARPALRRHLGTRPLLAAMALDRLRRQRLIGKRSDGYHLTPAGRDEAQRLLRSHRLWESYLAENLSVPADHTHGAAERLEHVTSAALRQQLTETTADSSRDPQGKAIPSEPD